MTSMKQAPWSPVVTRPSLSVPVRRALAGCLRTASTLLAGAAHRLALPAAVPAADPMPRELEFYADSAAPEGALYLDGELVGWLPGVRRL